MWTQSQANYYFVMLDCVGMPKVFNLLLSTTMDLECSILSLIHHNRPQTTYHTLTMWWIQLRQISESHPIILVWPHGVITLPTIQNTRTTLILCLLVTPSSQMVSLASLSWHQAFLVGRTWRTVWALQWELQFWFYSKIGITRNWHIYVSCYVTQSHCQIFEFEEKKCIVIF